MRLFLLLISFVLLTSNAKAQIIIEPFLGYGLSGDLNSGSGDSTVGQLDMDGPSMGARSGLRFDAITPGIEFRLNALRATDSSKASFDADATSFGLFVEYQLPFLIHGWISYSPFHQMKLKTSSPIKFKGRNIGVGVGVTFPTLPFMKFNIEYHSATYTKMEQGGSETSLNDTADNLLIFSIAVPVEVPLLF